MEGQNCSQLEEIPKSQAKINEEMFRFKDEITEEIAKFRAQHEEEMADIHSKLDALIDYFRMRSKGIETQLNFSPNGPTIPDSSSAIVVEDPIDDEMLEVYEFLDSEGNEDCESEIKHYVVEEKPSSSLVEAIKGTYVGDDTIEEGIVHGSTNGSLKAGVGEVTSGLKVDLGTTVMENDAHNGFDEITKPMSIDVMGVNRGMALNKNNLNSILVEVGQSLADLYLFCENNLMYVAFGECKDVILLIVDAVMFYFDPGGCHLPQIGCDPFGINGEKRNYCLVTIMADINVKPIIRKNRIMIASVFGVLVQFPKTDGEIIARVLLKDGLGTYVEIGIGRMSYYVDDSIVSYLLVNNAIKWDSEVLYKKDVDENSCVKLITACCGNILRDGGSGNLCSDIMDETLENFVKMFVYLFDTDLYAYFNWMELARLLLFDTSEVDEPEVDKMTESQQKCGDQFMTKMEGMITPFSSKWCGISNSYAPCFMNEFVKLLCTCYLPMRDKGHESITILQLVARSAGSTDIIQVWEVSWTNSTFGCLPSFHVTLSLYMKNLDVSLNIRFGSNKDIDTHSHVLRSGKAIRCVAFICRYMWKITDVTKALVNQKPFSFLIASLRYLSTYDIREIIIEGWAPLYLLNNCCHKKCFPKPRDTSIIEYAMDEVYVSFWDVVASLDYSESVKNMVVYSLIKLLEFTVWLEEHGVANLGRSYVHMINFCKARSVQWPTLLQAFVSRYVIPFSIQLSGIESLYHDSLVHLQELGWKLDKNVNTKVMFIEFVAISLRDLGIFMSDICEDEAVVINSALELHHLPAWSGAIKNVLSFVERHNVRKLKVHDVVDEIAGDAMRILKYFGEYKHDWYSVRRKIGWVQFSTVWLDWYTQIVEYIALHYTKAIMDEGVLLKQVVNREQDWICEVKLLDHLKHKDILLIFMTNPSKVPMKSGVFMLLLYFAVAMMIFVLAILTDFVWDPGLVWVSHFTTLRTRRLLRGRICHVPRLKIRKITEESVGDVGYELLAVNDVIVISSLYLCRISVI